MKLKKKSIYNIFFIILIALLLYPPAKERMIRFVAFSPTVIEKTDRQILIDYEWSLQGLNKASINGNELRGNVVFLNFWATWCPPCRAELPSIQKLYNDYRDKVNFVFVTNEKREVVHQYYKEKGYQLPTYNFASKLPSLLETTSIPQTFIINREGEIVVSKNGAADWNSKKIRKLLNELVSQK
ncbi:Thiol-disulfide isomerase or thioredoxin [Tenacibaculum sp. MAR_2009_124]|uniref:TlpA family protein disulfide reductase n=1 Tax=Tenacibaculum sp. MAR_2009_124 TaxID=1250059 RepID=UPI00089D05AC|nr:TlpA disulfide reductase family protein [Tenacibaculum sp. MAR_2009_124]SEB41653.1 Thiol-disulfide isomerase or thioredoxin [Tenacibaculum sp. MAR_2009_124]